MAPAWSGQEVCRAGRAARAHEVDDLARERKQVGQSDRPGGRAGGWVGEQLERGGPGCLDLRRQHEAEARLELAGVGAAARQAAAMTVARGDSPSSGSAASTSSSSVPSPSRATAANCTPAGSPSRRAAQAFSRGSAAARGSRAQPAGEAAS